MKAYVSALLVDIETLYSRYGGLLNTLYIGGGNPGTLKTVYLEEVLSKIYSLFGFVREEVTVEINPINARYDYLSKLFDLGVNRLSMGVQSFDESTLSLLGRDSTELDVLKAARNARRVGFKNLNLDLIYSSPFYTMDTLKTDIKKMINLDPEHISTYCLSLEPGTRLEQMMIKNNIPMPTDDEAADQLEFIIDSLKRAGYNRYEISNFSKPGMESKHNIAYWDYKNTLGAGAAAVYTYKGTRVENISSVSGYIKMVEAGSFPYGNVTKLSLSEQMLEYIMMGMRKSDGISTSDFNSRYGVEFSRRYADWIKKYTEMGLLISDGDRYRSSESALNVSNGILADLFLEKYL